MTLPREWRAFLDRHPLMLNVAVSAPWRTSRWQRWTCEIILLEGGQEGRDGATMARWHGTREETVPAIVYMVQDYLACTFDIKREEAARVALNISWKDEPWGK